MSQPKITESFPPENKNGASKKAAGKQSSSHAQTSNKTTKRHSKPYVPSTYQSYSKRDVEQYQTGYQDKPDNLSANDNWLFYTNKIPAKPSSHSIDEFHSKFYQDYESLEYNHQYIQWLFPIRESGMNYYAQELQLHEAKKISEDVAASNRFFFSYIMMLDFYGLKLKPKGEQEEIRLKQFIKSVTHDNALKRKSKKMKVAKKEPEPWAGDTEIAEEAKEHDTPEGDDKTLVTNPLLMKETCTGELKCNDCYEARFKHLNRSMHNYLRITRILKCLGELGYQDYQPYFVKFILDQILEKKELTNCLNSLQNYWLPVVKNTGERQELTEYLKENIYKISGTKRFSWV